MSDTIVPEDDNFEDLYQRAPCGYLSTSSDGRIIQANDTFLNWIGFTRSDLLSKRFQDLLTAGGRIFYETHYAPLLRMQGLAREIAVNFLGSNGRSLPAFITSSLSEGADVIRTIVFPATDRREYERELLRAKTRAEESESRARLLIRTLQSTFIPPSLPEIPFLDVAARYHPAGMQNEVGGDFYDLFQTGVNRWAFVIGDVSGKGAGAATVTALARFTIRAAAIRAKRPSVVLRTLNEALLRNVSDRFCTVLYASIGIGSTGGTQITFASAGHPLPLHVTATGHPKSVGRTGTALGLVDDPDLAENRLSTRPGDVLLFYTDGVTEARNEEGFFGETRLIDRLGRYRQLQPTTIADSISDEVIRFQANNPRDDVALVVMTDRERPSN